MSGRRQIGQMRAKRRTVRLSTRDHLLFRAIHKARVIRASDAAIFLFPSISIARRRMRALLDGGFLVCTIVALDEDNQWTLSPKGRFAIGLKETST